MENYGTALNYAAVSADSAGTATEKFEAYTNSIEGKLNSLTAASEEFALTVLNSDLIMSGVDMLQNLLEILTALMNFGDGAVIKIAAVVASIILITSAINKLTNSVEKLKNRVDDAKKGSEKFGDALTHFDTTGIEGLLLLIPRVIAGLVRMTKETGSFTKAWKMRKEGYAQVGLNSVLGTVSLITSVASVAIAIINGITDAAEKASKENKQAAEEAKQIAEAAQEQVDSLDDLIEKYKELREAGNYNTETREEIRNIQAQINQSVDDEALKLDLINDSLDEILRKYRLIKNLNSEESLTEAQNAYDTAQRSANTAYERNLTGLGPIDTLLAKMGGADLYVDSDYDEKAYDILMENYKVSDKSPKIAMGSGKNVFYFKNVSTAQEYVDLIDQALAKLDEAHAKGEYDTTNSRIYSALERYKAVYLQYLSELDEAATLEISATVRNIASELELDGAVVKTKSQYEDFKQAIYDTAVESERLQQIFKDTSLSTDDLQAAIEDYMASAYSDMFDKIEAGLPVYKSFTEVLNELQGAYDMINKAIDSQNESGYIAADVINELLTEYSELSEYLTETANGYLIDEEALNKWRESIIEGYTSALILAKTAEEQEIAYNELKEALVAFSTLDLEKKIEEETEALENEKDELNEQLNSYKDLIDVRKELLDSYIDELSYQEELTKKQKNIANLQARLSTARLDNSAAGQARVRELESQLNDAQEELDDFSIQHAVEEISKRLDKEYELNQANVNKQVDRIDEQIRNVAYTIRAETADINKLIQKLIDQNSPRVKAIDAAQSYINEHNLSESDMKWGFDEGFNKLFQDVLDNGGNIDDLTPANTSSNNSIIDKDLYNAIRSGNFVAITSWIAENLFDKTGNKQYHSGGIVGGTSILKSNEEFAKLLEGEYVSTPMQMRQFMEHTLPEIADFEGSQKTEINSPLITIQCGDITADTVDKFKEIVNAAVKEVSRQLDQGMSRTGRRKPITKLTI